MAYQKRLTYKPLIFDDGCKGAGKVKPFCIRLQRLSINICEIFANVKEKQFSTNKVTTYNYYLINSSAR